MKRKFPRYKAALDNEAQDRKEGAQRIDDLWERVKKQIKTYRGGDRHA